jgi:arylsulfatase A-like enzyme
VSDRPPNILFILTDNQGPDLVSCYGENSFPTPEIDRLAADGMVFESAFCTNGLCSPTRASLLTGLMPSQHGVHSAFYDNPRNMPEDYCAVREFRTLPLTLRNRGYQTAMIGKWHLGQPRESQVGFEHWVALAVGHTEDFYDNIVFENGQRRSVTDRHVVDYFGDKALDYLSAVDGSRPFFLQLNLDGPYALPPTNSGPDTRNPFYAECAARTYPVFPALDPAMTALICGPYGQTYKPLRKSREQEESDWVWECLFMHNDQESLANLAAQNALVDFTVGRVVDALAERGLDGDTLVVFSTDQSNPFGHHGLWGHPYMTIPSYIRDCTFRIPLIFRHPGVIRRGSRNRNIVSQCDLFPTLLDHVGFGDVPIPNSPGRSFAQMLRGEAPGEWEDVAYLEHEESRAIRTPSYLYVKRLSGVGGDELYDLTADPDQDTDVHEDAAYHDAIAMLNDRLCTFFEEFSDPKYDIWKGGRPKVTEYRLALFRRLFGQDWSTVSDSLPPFTENVPPPQRR